MGLNKNVIQWKVLDIQILDKDQLEFLDDITRFIIRPGGGI